MDFKGKINLEVFTDSLFFVDFLLFERVMGIAP